MRYCLYLCLLFSFCATSAELSPTARDEIDQLLAALKSSGCTFNRNGSWYDADKATEHLQSKYNYFLKKGELNNTESFIDKAASKSSASGQAYLVACPGAQTEESASWFKRKLDIIRHRADQ